MKFEKSVYKAAMDKIDNPEKRKEQTVNINQKYKSEILSGHIKDEWAGWDASNKTYDDEMMKKEVNKKMAWCLPFIVVGLIALFYATGMLAENITLRMQGTVCQAHLGWSRDVWEKGYIYRWTYADVGTTIDRNGLIVTGGDNLETSYIFIGVRLSSHSKAFVRYGEDGERFRRNSGGALTDDFVIKAWEAGIEPIEVYVMVNESVPWWKEGDKGDGEYMNLYYMPNKGETFLDMRLINRLWLDLVIELAAVLHIAFWIRRLIKLGREQRTYK